MKSTRKGSSKMKSTRREVEAARLRAEQRIAAATLIDVRRQVHGELYDIELSRLQMLKPSLHLPEGWTPLYLEQPALFYKVVAAVNGKLVSVFDGVTEYNLGRYTLSKRGAVGWPPLDTCYYAFPSPHAAVSTEFPPNSKHLDAPRVLLQVQARGRAYRRTGDMWAFCAVKPTMLVSDITQGKTYVIASRYAGLPGL